MHIKQERRCVACRKSLPQFDMLRVAKINNEFALDVNQKLGGRGAYICKSKECMDLAIKKKLLNRAFKMNVNPEIYEQLGEYEQNN